MAIEASRSRQAGGPAVTTLLWLFFLASGATNVVGNFTSMDNMFRLTAGGIAVAFLLIIIVRFMARRKD